MGIISAMTDNILPKPNLIETTKGLLNLISGLKRQPRVALDTESNSLYAYKEQVCLIQISIPSADYLLDPLQLSDLSPLKTILEDKRIEKILHGAEYDVICLKRDFNFHVSNLFDTRLALRTLGEKQTGLGDVLEQEFGVRINKRWQRANWGQRPLPSELMNYACHDTHFLLPLRDRLAKMLRAGGRWDEAREECEWITEFKPADNKFHPDQFWKISNAHQLEPQQAAILKEVFAYRDGQARRLNRPPFKVIPNKTLLAIAQVVPGDLDELCKLPGMTAGQIRRYGNSLLDAIERGLKTPPPRRPKSAPLDDLIVMRYKHLRKWRKRTAEERQVDSDIILPREIVWSIASKAPHTKEELRQVMKPLVKRFQMYGNEILQILRDLP
jgi:ribonuclease D